MQKQPDHLRKRVFCRSCGTVGTRRFGQAPIGWQEFPGTGGTKTLCPKCVRDNLFIIEAGFDFDSELGF